MIVRRLWTGGWLLVAGVSLVLAVVLMTVPGPVPGYRPVAWSPPAAEAPTAVHVQAGTTPVGDAAVHGPEDIAVDAAGRLHTGDRDGRILRFGADGGVEGFAQVGGRPLGLAFDRAGRLLVANHGIGLQAVLPDGRVQLLVDEVAGRPVRFANDLAIGPDGRIWFTDSSARRHRDALGGKPSYLVPDLLEGQPTGRLRVHDPATGHTAQALDRLYFPNGVAFTPDGVTAHGDTMLVAIYDRSPALDRLVLPTGLGRELIGRLPTSLFVSEADPLGGGVLTMSPDGVVRRWHSGIVPAPTNVVPHGGRWYLGALLGQPIRATTLR